VRTAAVVLALFTLAGASAGSAQVASPSEGIAPVRRVVEDYIGLYTKERLPEWKALFLPTFTATYTNADGTVSVRTLEEFYESQRAGFAKGPMSETLGEIRTTRQGRLAHVFADFDFTSSGKTRHGQLMMLLIESKGEFRIAALTFSYHLS
jgi:hypothetical protein